MNKACIILIDTYSDYDHFRIHLDDSCLVLAESRFNVSMKFHLMEAEFGLVDVSFGQRWSHSRFA